MGQLTITIICLCSIFLNLVKSQNTPSLEWQFDPYSTDQWFKQKLDHYDSGNIQHWPQRYVTSYRFYRLGGPIFLFLSGPGPELSFTDLETGAIAQYAEEQGAFIIGLEHRFYGKSQPTPDLSTENLHFLTIPQTIEDIATFVRSWRGRDEFRNSKWVVFGASYLGSLAAWFAQKHPELIDAFVASSAPLELRYEIPEFLENVGLVLNDTNPKCYDTIAEGFSCLTQIFNEEDCHNYTLADVKEKFNFCADLDRTRPFDATGVFAELFSTINAVVMYHDPNPDSFPDTNLDRFCKHVSNEKKNQPALDKIGEKVKEINKHRGVPCAEFRFQKTIDFLNEKSWDSDAAKEGYRQLQWQLCNELGWTVAAANISQPFGNYITPFLHAEICQSLFGLSETEMRLKVLKANTDLKGKAIKTKCGIFVNGDKDPWHTFSIITPTEAGSCNRALLIEGGSHGRDVEEFSNAPSYPPQVRDAQVQIGAYLDHWLKTGNCCDDGATADSKRVISTLSRPVRTPNSKDYYFAFNNLKHRPNVMIKPRSYSSPDGERLLVSPTSIPYQVSTTDVLSVSPRIPVAGGPSAGTERPSIDNDMFRDPRNAEFRRYRVVKLLRHHSTIAPPTQEPSMAPSMEQFEADFPEHSIRVEGRVERVYKNGTVIKPTEGASAETNEQLNLFDRGGRRLTNEATAGPILSATDRRNGVDGEKKNRFRFVVKQVFKDVVQGTETGGNVTQEKRLLASKEDASSIALDKKSEISLSPKNVEHRHSLQDANVSNNNFEQPDKISTSNSNQDKDNVSIRTSSSEQENSYEDSSGSKSSEESSEEEESLTPTQKQSEESKTTTESPETEDESISTSESVENTSLLSKQTDKLANKPEKIVVTVSSSTSSKTAGKSKGSKNETQDTDEDDEYYEDDYDDDDYYEDDDEYESKEDPKSKTTVQHIQKSDQQSSKSPKSTKVTVKPVSVSKKETNLSTEFSSGEDNRPRRLREKISEKIMSSSEDVEGDQKSKEKAKNSRNGHKERGSKSNNFSEKKENGGDYESSRSLTEEADSGEAYNFSLEPSGSNPKGSFRKKQLAPITKPVIEEPSTVINVEISGSYPKKSKRRRKHKKPTTTESSVNVAGKDLSSRELDREKKTEQRERKKHHRRKKVNRGHASTGTHEMEQNYDMKSTTPQTTRTSATTIPSSTTVASVAGLSEPPPTNSYAVWNREKALEKTDQMRARPIEQEVPSVVNLDNSHSDNSIYLPPEQETTPTPDTNNNVIYIIIGDIPTEGDPNIINQNPSKEALFNFIQKLVNRHKPGLLPVSGGQFYNPSPSPPTTPSTTTTTTTAPPPTNYNHGFHDQTGRYLLVRPIQVIPIGRDHVVHAQDLKNESLVTSITMETPTLTNPYPFTYQIPQNTKRQHHDAGGSYRFKSPLHRDHFERLLSVDGQVRDSDRDTGYYQHNSVRRLDELPDPSWRSIRGVTQFGPVMSSSNGNPTSGLLSLTAADTTWVDQGVPFLPRGRQLFTRGHQKVEHAR